MSREYIFRQTEITCRDALGCFFNLNPLEVNVFNAMSRLGPLTNKELADEVSRDRSTVFRALNKLISCGLCSKETEVLDMGGVQNIFVPVSPLHVKKELGSRIDQWSQKMRNSLTGFDDLYVGFDEKVKKRLDKGK